MHKTFLSAVFFKRQGFFVVLVLTIVCDVIHRCKCHILDLPTFFINFFTGNHMVKRRKAF